MVALAILQQRNADPHQLAGLEILVEAAAKVAFERVIQAPLTHMRQIRELAQIEFGPLQNLQPLRHPLHTSIQRPLPERLKLFLCLCNPEQPQEFRLKQLQTALQLRLGQPQMKPGRQSLHKGPQLLHRRKLSPFSRIAVQAPQMINSVRGRVEVKKEHFTPSGELPVLFTGWQDKNGALDGDMPQRVLLHPDPT